MDCSHKPNPLAAFERDGYVVLEQFLSPSCLEDWFEFSDQIWKEIFQVLHSNNHTRFPSHCQFDEAGDRVYALSKGIKNCFREIVMRSPGRYEISLLHPFTSRHPPLEMILEKLATILPPFFHMDRWNDLQICNISLIVSTPGSTEQAWHADGGHVSVTEHLPCHCLNVFLPLTQVTEENGPTEFRPGSQMHTRNLVPMMLAAKARKTLRKPTAPLLAVGDALVFDYRVLHRGKANKCRDETKNRTMLCITIAQSWFKDIVNFPRRSIEKPGL